MSRALDKPLMPTATAVWLIDNTSLTFEQIANFCGLHKLEIEGIANEDVAHGVKGFDPIASGQLTVETIEKCQDDSALNLELDTSPLSEEQLNSTKSTKGRKQPRYTPVSRRRDRPDAIAWLIRNHPEISDGQTSRLIGTTKSTITAVRSRTHWNAPSIKPVDPVSLGLCSQKALDEVVDIAARRKEQRDKKKRREQRRTERQAQQNTEEGEGAGAQDEGAGAEEGEGEGTQDESERISEVADSAAEVENFEPAEDNNPLEENG